MPKNLLRDIMAPGKRSGRDAPLRARQRSGEPDEEVVVYEQETIVEEDDGGGRRGWSRPFLWGAALIFVILLGVALASGFSGSTVTVTPKTAVIAVNSEFVASKTAASKLRFEAVPFSETASLSIPADTQKRVSRKASGTIIVYNNFSAKTQRLIRNTRFQSSSGLIYRINDSLVIPGFTKEGDKVIPGSIETAVFADAPGADYNLGLTDFTIPGFRTDSARYAGFYARSKTPLAGGFEGNQKTASDDAIAATRAKLDAEADAKIRAKALASVPPEFIFFSDALTIDHDSPVPEVKSDSATVTETAKGAAYLIRRGDLEQAVAAAAMPGVGDFPVTLPELSLLSFAWTEKPAPSQPPASIRFSLRGNVRAIWNYDKEKLKTALLGKQKSELPAILSAFPMIEKVDLVMRPFWTGSFPTNPDKLSIKDTTLTNTSK